MYVAGFPQARDYCGSVVFSPGTESHGVDDGNC